MTRSLTFFSPLLRRVSFFVVLLITIIVVASHSLAATGSMPLTGYVWSSNIGWISFSGTNYGVFEDKASGALSGYAWSSNFGWVTFNESEVSGCPSGPCAPKVNPGTGAVSGFARACAAFANKNLCSGDLDTNSGGWDGWISLSGSMYGITQSKTTCAWSGYAWGSDAIGWISASGTATNGSPYGVTGNDPAICAPAPVTAPFVTLSASPTQVASGGSSTLTWVSTNSPTSCTASGDWSGQKDITAGSHTETITNITSNKTFTLTCMNGSGSDTKSVTVSISSATPSASLSVSPTSGQAGSTMFTYTATPSGFKSGGTLWYYFIFGDNKNEWSSSATKTHTYSSAGTYQPTVRIENRMGSLGQDQRATSPPVRVTVTAPSSPLPTATLSASPSAINSGGSSTLTWSSTNATSCTAAGGFSTGGATSNSTGVLVSPTITSTYSITCTGPGGTSSPATATVTVSSPLVSINASPARLRSGNSSTISWSASEVKSCVVSGPGLSSSSLTGSQAITISSQSRYTITCETNGQPITDFVIVNVTPDFEEF